MASGQLLRHLELGPGSVERDYWAVVLSVDLLIGFRSLQQLV